MGYKEKYKNWLLSDYFDDEIKAELKEIEDDEEEIEDRFYKDLDFGTGGLRGKIGAGTNRMNKYTIRKTTQGLANYIVNYIDAEKEKGVVISYDSRHKSYEFAREAALVLAGNDIKAYLFSEMAPVPVLSFAVRELNVISGIMITASHNPPEYNGYKVYGEDGGQVVPDKARKITAEIDEIDDYSLVKMKEESEARSEGRLEMVGEEIFARYQEEVMKVIPDTELAQKEGAEFKILYTPLHGTGYKPVTSLLSELGFKFSVVEEQAEPDPDFSTVKKPNPENFSSFKLALEQAEKENPDLILGTDPDCDRLGVVIKDNQGEYISLTGNEAGVLMLDYLLSRSEIPENAVVIKTIVTTELAREIARDYGVEIQDVLTGFKYIGEKIKIFKETGEKEFVFGFEESYGYLAGTHSRDKDAALAAGLFAVLSLYYQKQDLSIPDRLEELREKYGYFLEDLESIYLEGKEGQEKIASVLNHLREERPEEIAGKQVVRFSDYREQISIDMETGAEEEIKLPESDVLQFYLADDSKITIRPSGTEPKLKLYFSVKQESEQQAEETMAYIKQEVVTTVEDLLSQIE